MAQGPQTQFVMGAKQVITKKSEGSTGRVESPTALPIHSIQLSPGLRAVLPGLLNFLEMPESRVDPYKSFGDVFILPVRERGRERKPVRGIHFHLLGTPADVLSD